MALATSNVDADEVAVKDLGMPSWLFLNILDQLRTSGFGGTMAAALEWRDQERADGVGTLIATKSGNEVRRCHDRRGRSWTQINTGLGASLNNLHLIANLTDGTDEAHTIDTIYVQGLNFKEITDSLGGTLTIRVTLSDQADFTSLNTTAFTWTGVNSNKGLVALDLLFDDTAAQNQQFTGVLFASLRITATGGNFTSGNEPRIAQFVLGKRRQMGVEPNEDGYDDDPYLTSESTFVAQDGDEVGNVNYKRKFIADGWVYEFVENGINGVAELTNARAMYDDSLGKPGLFIRKPIASPPIGHWIKLGVGGEQRRHFSFISSDAMDATIDMRELPPHQAELV